MYSGTTHVLKFSACCEDSDSNALVSLTLWEHQLLWQLQQVHSAPGGATRELHQQLSATVYGLLQWTLDIREDVSMYNQSGEVQELLMPFLIII